MPTRPAIPASPSPKKRRRWKFWLAAILIAPLIFFGIYTWFVLTWSYSSGEHVGFVQKFSKKGFLSKTWEGELATVSMPGTVQEVFHFTVAEDSIADQINKSMGRRVRLMYEQHIGIPSRFFGETEFFIVRVEVVE